MDITVTDVPKCIKTFVFSPRVILSEKTTIEYLLRMKEYIFGSSCIQSAEKIGIDVFDLVFIGERSFSECCEFYLNKIRDRDKDITDDLCYSAFFHCFLLCLREFGV